MQQYPTMQNYGSYQPYQYYNPMLTPQQRLQQMELQYPQFTPQQTAQMPPVNQMALNGHIVDDFSQVTADMVPMDGTGAFFIKRDGSEIQRMVWGNMGNIETTSYLPHKEENNAQALNSSNETENAKFDLSDASTEAFMKRFDDVVERIEKLEKSISAPAKSTRAKKEADSE